MKSFIFGSASAFKWTHDYLFTLLTKGKNHIVKSENIQSAFELVDRADFVPVQFQEYAYDDAEIDLGYESFLEKPTVIAQMLQLATPPQAGNFLEIGTGSAYTAALLAVAGGPGSTVTSLERNQFLADIARINIKKYPFLNNVDIVFHDGTLGYTLKAPYDTIIISASYENIPSELLKQIKVGGKLVVPLHDNSIALYVRSSETEFKESRHKAYFFDKIKAGIE